VTEGEESLEALLARLEALVGRLADQSAPLDRLVGDYTEARRLLDLAERRLAVAGRRLDVLQRQVEAPLSASGEQ
jgi:exodeoxyribonuclease VII small subunit